MKNRYVTHVFSWIFVLFCGSGCSLVERATHTLRVGAASATPSSIVNTGATSVEVRVEVRKGWFQRIGGVWLDGSGIPGADAGRLPMNRDGSVWSAVLDIPEHVALGTYTAAVVVTCRKGNELARRPARIHVAEEQGIGFARADHPYFRYQGRMLDQPDLLWPGSSVEVRFRGSSVSARFDNTDTNAIFYVIIDGDDGNPSEIRLEEGELDYLLAEGLDDGWHELRLHRITEIWDECRTVFKGLVLKEGRGILPPRDMTGRKIEFYGDSITAGNHAEKGRKETDDKARANNYLSYSARTARALDAEYRCIARSGIALTSRYKPEEAKMDTFYRRSLPYSDEPEWDFSRWQPDVVVIHMLTNDDWFWGNRPVAEIPSDEWFKERYKEFLLALRERYPDACFFCVQGTMPSVADWPPPNPDMVWVIEQAVEELNRSGDKKFYSLMFKYQHPDPGHPSSWHHKHYMADKLVPLIRKKTGWW